MAQRLSLPAPSTSSPSASGRSAIAAATRSASRSATPLRPSTQSRCSARSAPGASTSTTTTSSPSTPRRRTDAIVRDFKPACQTHGLVVPMATVNLFTDPASETARSRRTIRRSAPTPSRRRCARWTWARNWARRSTCSGAGAKAPRPTPAGGRTRRSSASARRSTICAPTPRRQKYDYRFALEAKPNEPRGDIYLATTGDYLGFIRRSIIPSWSASIPKWRTSRWRASTSSTRSAQAWEAGKLFHIDLNDQKPGRYDQDFRFGSPIPLGVLPRQVPRRRRLRRPAPLRRPRVSHRRLRRREGVRPRLHAHVPDPEGQGRALERRPRDPGARPRFVEDIRRSALLDRRGGAQGRKFDRVALARAAWATNGSISSRGSAAGRAMRISGARAATRPRR